MIVIINKKQNFIKDENVHRYEERGEKVKLVVRKKIKDVFLRLSYIDDIWLVLRRHWLIRYEDERYGVSESPKSLVIEILRI